MSDPRAMSIYLGADAKLVLRDLTETYTPKGSQSLVRVHYSGVNQCDLNFAHIGLNSFVTGFEFSGIIEQPGRDSPFKKGAAVCGLPPVAIPKPSSTGSHQDLCIAEDSLLYLVPPGLDLKDAGGTVMACHTAADGLFNGLGFGFPAAGVSGADPRGHPILIWGGATSVGIAAIQAAKSAGFDPIFTTASPKNHPTLQLFGATHCFDYRNPTVLDTIWAAAKARGVKLTTGFDAAGKGGTAHGEEAKHSTPVLTKSALSDDVGPDEIKLVSTTMVPGIPQFRTCAAFRPAGDRDSMGHPQDPEAPTRIRRVTEYFLRSAETSLKFPAIKVVKGGSAGIGEIERVAGGGASMEKVVIEHPI